MFRNKHLTVALLIAPVLSLMAYFVVDYALAEKPQAAEAGRAYPLTAKPGCRYQSGRCGLENGDFRVELTAKPLVNGKLQLMLTSVHPLQGAGVAIATEHDNKTPTAMTPATRGNAKDWIATVPFEGDRLDRQQLRIAMSVNGAFYYGEASLVFVDYQTAYQKDFR
ncbi:MAG: hypothetical protein R3208_06330 [Ketobacteraceae bacterium]|nr:hypothetical protein [Ketobacteraceae bacterium]